ncbi:YhcN/YlaJ family sporulation lipoprotein [Salipaludibacillus keqinensis]|nr:YhcN/YlaJ family sporulation lipoprotein [Salipaludibacillus keqinensis]
MKKIALGLSVVTILLSGVACGDMEPNNTEGQGYSYQQRDQTGYGNDRIDGTGMGSSNYGQRGMMGRETERYGNRNQAGRDRMTGYQTGQGRPRGFTRGITGNDRQGMVDENGLLNGRLRASNRNQTDNNLNRGMGDGMFRGTSNTGNKQGSNVTGYYDSKDGQTARKLENRIENIDGVRDCDVLINGDDVVIGIDASGNEDRVERKVRSLASKLDDNKQVHIVTDQSGMDRINGMENQLRDGAPFEEVGATFNEMLDDLGDALQRPFERSR